MKRSTSIILGLIVIAVGAIWGLNAVGLTDIDIFFDGWWTLFIIVPCTVGLIKGGDRTGSLIGLVVGVLLLLTCQDVFDYEMIWKLVVPVIIVGIGLKLVFKGIAGNRNVPHLTAGNVKGKSHSAIFSGQELDYTNEVFEGGNCSAVFGGIEYDLRHAIITKDVVINATCVFGGVEVLLPPHVNLKTTSTSIFGGIEEKGHRNMADNTVTVYINGTCIFGGIDIK